MIDHDLYGCQTELARVDSVKGETRDEGLSRSWAFFINLWELGLQGSVRNSRNVNNNQSRLDVSLQALLMTVLSLVADSWLCKSQWVDLKAFTSCEVVGRKY
jgi:hypothetical protein